MPTTSQVSVVTMQHAIKNLIDKDYDVLGVFISAKLSGTFQSAIQGREALGTAAGKITLVDSNSTSMAMGFQILTAVRAAGPGASLIDRVALVEKS